MPLLRIRDVGKNETETRYTGIYDETYLVRGGDIVVGMDGDFKVSRWHGGPALLNQRVCKIEVDAQRFLPEWLLYLLPGYLDAIGERTSAITVKHLSSRDLLELPLPCPPVDEQRSTVVAIEEQFSRLEAAVQSLEGAEARVLALRKSIYRHALGGDWPSVPLATVVDPDRPITYGILMPKDNVPDGVPYVRVKDMKADRIDVNSLRRTSHVIAEEYRRSKLRDGDVLVSIRGTYGRVAVVPVELDGANITQDTARVAPGPMVLAAYLASVLRGPASQAYMRRLARGVAVKGVNLGDLKVLPIPLPPLELQEQLIEAVQDQTDRIARFDAVIATALRRAEPLRQSILNAAFTGRLVKGMATVQTDLVPQPQRLSMPAEVAR